MELKKKGRAFRSPQFLLALWLLLHKVRNGSQTIVFVGFVSVESTNDSIGIGRSERIRDHSVPSFEANFWLEGIFANGADHLQRHVWAIE